jgi:hypothetical protein
MLCCVNRSTVDRSIEVERRSDRNAGWRVDVHLKDLDAGSVRIGDDHEIHCHETLLPVIFVGVDGSERRFVLVEDGLETAAFDVLKDRGDL